MKTENWFKYFDDNCEKFHWVFTKHGFEKQWTELIEQRELKSRYLMEQILIEVWYRLPEEVYATSADPGQIELLILISE